MEIKVLGPGCANCTTFEKRSNDAVAATGVAATVEKVTDFAKIVSNGVISTPALVIDDQVVVSGRVPKADEIEALQARS